MNYYHADGKEENQYLKYVAKLYLARFLSSMLFATIL